jgi:hypothetical protein
VAPFFSGKFTGNFVELLRWAGFGAARTLTTSNACISISLFRRSREFSKENREKGFSEQGILSLIS